MKCLGVPLFHHDLDTQGSSDRCRCTVVIFLWGVIDADVDDVTQIICFSNINLIGMMSVVYVECAFKTSERADGDVRVTFVL